MSIRKPLLALTATAAFAAAALPTTPAQATSVIYAAPATASAPWPVWVLGGGVLSIMVRAAYVYRTECRQLTGEEAFGGMGPWPVYHQARNQCKPAAAPVIARSSVVGRY